MRQKIVFLVLALALLSTLTGVLALETEGELSVEWCDWETKTYTSASAQTVSLTLNGAPLAGDVPAMIQGGRALVPVRLVAEALGAEVIWVQKEGQIILAKGTNVVILTLGSETALVNGYTTPLPDQIPAQVVRYQGADRTMVPLRFVSEHLGASVNWDQNTQTVLLTAAQANLSGPSSPTGAESPEGGELLVTEIQADEAGVTLTVNGTPNYQLMGFDDRLVIDIFGASLSEALPAGTLEVDGDVVAAVRYSQHGQALYPEYAHTVRVVLDVQPGISVQENMTVEGRENGILISTYPEGLEAAGATLNTPSDATRATVVIDPGHGGDRSGAHYEGISEKDINLAVSLKLEAILRGYGYNVVMTRAEDVEMDLYVRSYLANAVDADLFVSLHSNAASNNPDYQGIYTYYHPTSRRGAELAQTIQTPLCQATGGIDRGIRDADFVVVRETNMAAVLVEMGFMSNHEELMKLVDSDYQDKLAQGIAEGIVRYLTAQQGLF